MRDPSSFSSEFSGVTSFFMASLASLKFVRFKKHPPIDAPRSAERDLLFESANPSLLLRKLGDLALDYLKL